MIYSGHLEFIGLITIELVKLVRNEVHLVKKLISTKNISKSIKTQRPPQNPKVIFSGGYYIKFNSYLIYKDIRPHL